jgi:hypothetical protein
MGGGNLVRPCVVGALYVLLAVLILDRMGYTDARKHWRKLRALCRY